MCLRLPSHFHRMRVGRCLCIALLLEMWWSHSSRLVCSVFLHATNAFARIGYRTHCLKAAGASCMLYLIVRCMLIASSCCGQCQCNVCCLLTHSFTASPCRAQLLCFSSQASAMDADIDSGTMIATLAGRCAMPAQSRSLMSSCGMRGVSLQYVSHPTHECCTIDPPHMAVCVASFVWPSNIGFAPR